MQNSFKQNIIERLQQQILSLEGFKEVAEHAKNKVEIAKIESSFPHHIFPTGVIHEFLNPLPEQTACTSAFISVLLSKIHQKKGFYLWISKQRHIFPTALKNFGIQPHQIIFINLTQPKDLLWATEEALKCKGVSAVISELDEISFAQSQRLQLTVEKSKVTGFILRSKSQAINATACAARWEIRPSLSFSDDDLPGVGFTQWQVNLLKVRNGNPASYQITWRNHQLLNNDIHYQPTALHQSAVV
jgi:protein ImuA